MLGLERDVTRTAALFDPSTILPGEADLWNLALMMLLLSCAAVPAGRRRRTLPHRPPSGRCTSLALVAPTLGEETTLSALAHSGESWDSAGPGCLFPVAKFPVLASEPIGPAVASYHTSSEEGTSLDAPLPYLPQQTNDVPTEELGRVVKLAVGALVLTQLAVPLIRRYQRQPRTFPGARAAC